MGFRFRRSIKLLPGLRVNISKSGLSLSVGRPGATVNFSQRGTYSTFGIPGTGMSWRNRLGGGQTATSSRQLSSGSRAPDEAVEPIGSLGESDDPTATLVHPESGRQLSERQIDAARRRFLQKQRREEAAAKVAAEEATRHDVVNYWRTMSQIPPHEVYQEACQVGHFVFNEQLPEKPDLAQPQELLHMRVRRELKKSGGPSHVLHFAAVVGAAAIGLVIALVAKMLGFAVGGVVVAMAIGILLMVGSLWAIQQSWKADLETSANEEMERRWPNTLEELRANYHVTCQAYLDRQKAAFEIWKVKETERVNWARRLIGGDTDVIEESVADSLADLDFPFETRCTVSVDDKTTAYLHLDLPEIEDIEPLHREVVLKDGQFRHVKREATERNGEYGTLVAGLGVLVSGTAFTAAPTLEKVHVAAYTQRKRASSDAVGDAYLYYFEVTRQQLAAVDASKLDSIALILSIGGQIKQKQTLELQALRAPEWVMELRNATERCQPS